MDGNMLRFWVGSWLSDRWKNTLEIIERIDTKHVPLNKGVTFCKSSFCVSIYVGLSPLPVPVANEGL